MLRVFTDLSYEDVADILRRNQSSGTKTKIKRPKLRIPRERAERIKREYKHWLQLKYREGKTKEIEVNPQTYSSCFFDFFIEKIRNRQE